MVRFLLRVTKMHKIINEDIRGTGLVELKFEDKVIKARLRWFGHVEDGWSIRRVCWAA